MTLPDEFDGCHEEAEQLFACFSEVVGVAVAKDAFHRLRTAVVWSGDKPPLLGSMRLVRRWVLRGCRFPCSSNLCARRSRELSCCRVSQHPCRHWFVTRNGQATWRHQEHVARRPQVEWLFDWEAASVVLDSKGVGRRPCREPWWMVRVWRSVFSPKAHVECQAGLAPRPHETGHAELGTGGAAVTPHVWASSSIGMPFLFFRSIYKFADGNYFKRVPTWAGAREDLAHAANLFNP